jgi:LL-diaminopimelate aminotransferase
VGYADWSHGFSFLFGWLLCDPVGDLFYRQRFYAEVIKLVPWDDAGAILRFSVTFAAGSPSEEKRVLAEIARRLSDVKLEF